MHNKSITVISIQLDLKFTIMAAYSLARSDLTNYTSFNCPYWETVHSGINLSMIILIVSFSVVGAFLVCIASYIIWRLTKKVSALRELHQGMRFISHFYSIQAKLKDSVS